MVWDFHLLFCCLLLAMLEAQSVALDGSCHRGMTFVLPILISAAITFTPRDGVPMYSELSLAKQREDASSAPKFPSRYRGIQSSSAWPWHFQSWDLFFLSVQNPLHLTFSKAFCVLFVAFTPPPEEDNRNFNQFLLLTLCCLVSKLLCVFLC